MATGTSDDRERARAYVRALVDAAPPLRQEQRDKLAELLKPVRVR